ncbi:MAG TPA: gephyrin-like molybdotransferase Glp [Dongiaceae bacterium]|jgi:molybdopterin molybdotransferase|nr:gephyrin-like molybdotransferase Glp [Dongiaceae bacterium]
MLTVAEARTRIVQAFAPLPAEQVSLANALGRVLAEPVHARLTQPPFAVSAMDGYAVRAADVAKVPVTLKLVGYAPAGRAYASPIKAGEAVRIFTGAPLPDGADAIVIQENTQASDDSVLVKEAAPAGRYVRAAGLDFRRGDLGVAAGKKLGARDIGLAAAMNHPWLQVRRRPRVAILATGDEIVMPGEPVGPHQIVSSNGLALAAFFRAAGAEPIDLGIAADNRAALQRLAAGGAGADLLVTTGGASVGDHDLVQAALGDQGMAVDFWKIAMRPGKPLMFGNIGTTKVIGLPGNPVSTLVCALVFIRPALRAMLGQAAAVSDEEDAIAGSDLAENDNREDYLRSRLARDGEGRLVATPFGKQDSSMQFLLQQSDCLLIRPVRAGALPKGSPVRILRLDDGL